MSKENELISIIVPIYNVEKYLEKCVLSIVEQSYKNIEILLINDGSKDKSGQICEYLSKKDKRIKVYHKKNGGLSSARNYGIDKAIGEYIMFIDSDDYIYNEMIKMLYTNLIMSKSDIACCGMQMFTNDNEIKYNYSYIFSTISSKEALLEMINYNNCIYPNANNKLYKRNLFTKDCYYPVGKKYEDMGITAKIISKSKKIVYTMDNYYFYFQRQNSITNQKFVKSDLDHIEMSEKLLDFIKENEPSIIKEYKIYHIFNMISCCNKIISSKEKRYYSVIEDTKKTIKENTSEIFSSKIYSNKKKFQLVIFAYLNNVYKILFRILRG